MKSKFASSLVAVCLAWLMPVCLSGPGGSVWWVNSATAAIVTFEDVGDGLPFDGFYNGGPSNNSDGWSSGGVQFENTFTDFGGGFTGWEGWAYSTVRDIVTAGFANQYAAYSASGTDAGFGSGNSRTYALAFPGSQRNNNGSVLSFATTVAVESIDVTNTTYALLGLRDGNDGGAGFVAQFQDGDFFRLSITGFDGAAGSGNPTGSVDVDLANYGGAGADDNQIIDDWVNVDLSGLGQVRSLRFSLDSNVVDTFDGIAFLNTPSYVAIDNLSFSIVPEPSGLGLATVGWAMFCRRRRKRAA